MNHIDALKPQIDKIQQFGLVAAALGGLATVIGAILDPAQFFESYLLGFLFWVGLPVGSLALMSLHHLVGGGWGFAIQRVLESCSRTIPLLALLFVPILFGMPDLYIWARPDVVAADKILQHKAGYLNTTFFTIRTAVFFGVWSLFIFLMNRWSVTQDKTDDEKMSDKLSRIGGPGLLVFFLTITFASIDWGMSLDPHWFSTIYGFVFAIGQGVLTMAFAIIMLFKFIDQKPFSDVVEKKHFHDLGNLLLAFLSLWAYVNLSQFLIIWSGNLPEEIGWYLHRMHGGWGVLAIVIVAFHFFVPFALLLLRRNKRRGEILAKIAAGVILVRFIDLFWLIVPNFHQHGFHIHWLDVAAPVGMGGLWLAAFAWQLKGRELLPFNDPRLKEAFSHD